MTKSQVFLLSFFISCSSLAAERPNIVIIFTDDQGYGDLGSYGLTTAETPHLDRMAEEGTRFTSFYSQPLCGPARSALLTGRYPSRSKGWGMPASEITFAELMQKTGYATACIGKWDVSNRKPIRDRMPLAQGFDFYWGPLGANDAGHVALYENNQLIGKDEDLASLSRRFTDKSIEWMKERVEGGDDPFLLYLCHTMMHTVIDASPEFRDRTGNGLYADTLEELDHECGRLLKAIDDLGIAEDTLVIFTSDNGAWSNDAEKQNPKNAAVVEWTEGEQTAVGTNAPLREGKASSYEGGVRVPCLVRWPGTVPAGRVNDAIFATLDFLPTFAHLAGFEVPDDRAIDGVNQVDLLTGESEAGNRDTYFYHSGSHGVRQGKWKLLRANRWSPAQRERRTYPKDFGTNGIELYNLDGDIGETTNLADQHPDIVERLKALPTPAQGGAVSNRPTKQKGGSKPPLPEGKGKPGSRQRLHSPNIVFFMADDLGIGDVQCYNPDSSVPTPHIDALAAAGTRFTDAHSPSAVCSPTRYSVLTGRYPWRDGVAGALQGIHDPALQRNQPVLPKFLGRYGYRSAMIGKWHIGLRFAGDYRITGFGQIKGSADFHQPLVDGPTHHGFDYFFGVNGNFNIAQHLDFWIENDRVLAPGSLVAKMETHRKLGIVLDSWRAENWNPQDLTRLPLKKALAFLDDHQAKHADRPFYLHFTPNAIHKDFFPNKTLNGEPVQGQGGELGDRGELIVETDIMLGALVAKLKELRIFEETIVVFTSDNGGQGATEALEVGHRINGPWAGCKGMILEGGHRVPYLLSYPDGGVEAGAVDDETELGLVDWFPSVATYVAGPEAVAKLRPFDGADRSALFEGEKPAPREHALIHSGNSQPIGQIERHPIMDEPRFGGFAVREGDWKLIVEGIRGKPWGLFNLGEDPGETTNLLKQHPERVERMRKRFVEAREAVKSLNPSKRADASKGKVAAKQASPPSPVEKDPAGHSTGSGPRPNPVASKKEPLDPDRLLPAEPQRFVHFADQAPHYVFDTICFHHDDEFHVFYLNAVFPPKGGPKTGVKWSHAKTRDFVHWETLPDALLPGDLDPNCWTGSLIEKDGTFYLFYTGKSLPDRPDPKGDQKVMLATSTDLVHFEKQPDFTFYADGEIYWNKHVNGPLDPEREIHNQRDESFRDPEVFWNEEHGEYWMLLHAREAESQKHCFGVYRSDDLLTWTPREPLEITVPVHQRNIDCPDLFPLGDKWVLMFSGGGYYALADRSEGPFGDYRSLDHNLYVPKTTVDEKGRRLINGTIRPNKGVTGGRASMVRELYLADDGRVQQRPLPEVIAAFPETRATLEDLADEVVTGTVEKTGDGLRLVREQKVARVKANEPKDFLADFTVTLEEDSVFRLNFRRGEGQATTQCLEISTGENHIRLGTIHRHTGNTGPVRDRVHRVPVGEPLRVRLFSVGTVTTVFVEDQVTLTMNALSLKNTGLMLEAFTGAVTIHDFALRAPAAKPTQEAKAQPGDGAKDILFLAIDDLNTWSKLYDPEYPIHMPNLERLAARGALFTRAYCAAPACAPSRAAVMSGQRPTTSGLYNNPNKLEDHHADTVFLPQWFQRHGYRTWGVGKLLHGEPATIGNPPRPIFEKFTRKKVIFPDKHLNGKPKHSPIYDWGVLDKKLSDDFTVDLAIQHLRADRTSDPRPAFQAVGIFSPHLPHFARPEHFAQYPREDLILPPMPEDDFDDVPAAGRAMADFQKFWNQHLFDARDNGDLEPLAKLVQSYQAAATYGDEMLGRLLDALDATGRADDTIIVLWSDHGYHLGDKDSVVKFTLWEMACRVPLVIVAPGVTEPGTRIDTPVSLVDLYPTLIELAGLPNKPGLDGESLVPLLKNPDHPRETPAITTFLEGNHAVATKDWRYLRYADGSEELYRAGDVWNHENVAGRPENADALSTLRTWLKEDANR